MKRKQALLLGLTVLQMFFLAGCGNGMEKDSLYSFESREAAMQASILSADQAEPFAADLCVVENEAIYNSAEVNAEAAAVFSAADQEVVYSKNAYERLYPASITKVMTAILALKYGDLSDMVTVTNASVITEAGASLAEITPGDQLTLEQLLYGLMLPSGNDAANAIAVYLSGSVEEFAELMNKEAEAIGATGTHFMNPSGLNNSNHYTTAYDLYLMFREGLKDPRFREIIETPSYTANYINAAGEPVSKTWMASNWYINGERSTPEGLTVLGGKTGTTNAAGYCLIMASSTQEGREYISVVLKAGSRPSLYDNMTNIISKIVD